MSGFQHIRDEPVYDGYIWRVVVGEFRDPDGESFTRDIVRSPGAVAAVPLLEADGQEPRVVLTRQFRAAFNDFIVEVPAGMRDVDGEDPAGTARRELIEEAGYDADEFMLLHHFYPSTGMTDSTLHVYLARGLRHVGRDSQGPEESHMEVFDVSLSDAVEMILRGEIADAKSTIGILLTERLLRES